MGNSIRDVTTVGGETSRKFRRDALLAPFDNAFREQLAFTVFNFTSLVVGPCRISRLSARCARGMFVVVVGGS